MDLKSFREEKLKIKTQAEFAELIGVEQSSISRWEKDASNIPFTIIQRIMEKTGATLEEVTGYRKPIPKALNIEDTWKNVNFTKSTITEYIYSELQKIGITEDIKKLYIDELYTGIVSSYFKPKVAIVGRSDTGKSTLINALLGVEKMPTSWTPTTTIAIYIKHTDDRPKFIEEDVWLFSDSSNEEIIWDDRKLNDEEYCMKWKIASGDIETLRSYGTRQGENYDKAAGSAVVFVNSPILKNCDIIDLPGFGTETDKDDTITFSISRKADVIIYLSQANGFMRIEDITYLKQNIKALPIWERKFENNLKPLGNLFVVASQAHTVNNGNRTQLNEILDVACKNLSKSLPDKYFEEREEISKYKYSLNGNNELRSRFFAYTTDILDICKDFNESLSEVLESLPLIINEKIKDFVKDYVSLKKLNLTAEINKYEEIILEREKYESLLKEIEKNRLNRVQDNSKRKNYIQNEIKNFCIESKSEFYKYISKTVNVDSIVSMIEDRGVNNKKESIDIFASYFTSLIEEECNNILKEKSEKLTELTREYINNYSNSILTSFTEKGVNIDFDANLAFVTAIYKIALLGGLGAYGLYLASSVSLLGSLGIVGAMSFVQSIPVITISSIFGPIGITIGIALIAGLVLLNLFGGSWKKSVAKKIVEAFEKQNLIEKYKEGIDKYWKETAEVFDKATSELDKEFEKYVDDLKKMLNNYDIDTIKNNIRIFSDILIFFKNIPL